MELIKFFIGMVVGIIVTVMFVMTLPLYWDSHRKNVEAYLGKQSGQITVVVGWNPNCQHISKGTAELSGDVAKDMETSRWEEYFARTYRDKEEAIKVRNKLLQVMRE